MRTVKPGTHGSYGVIPLAGRMLVGILYYRNLKEMQFNGISCDHKRLQRRSLRLELRSIVLLAQPLLLTIRHMRITLSPITKLPLLCTALAGALLTFSNSAQAFSIRDADAFLGHSERSTYVNHLTDLTGPAVRSDERSNGHYFGPGNSTRQAQSTDRINDRNTASPGRIITIPNPSGVPGSGTGVPDGGTTVDVARRGPRCAWYGTALSIQLTRRISSKSVPVLATLEAKWPFLWTATLSIPDRRLGWEHFCRRNFHLHRPPKKLEQHSDPFSCRQ